MAIAGTSWSSSEVALACAVSRTASTRLVKGYERRLRLLISAARALEPDLRPWELAEIILSVIETGSALATADRSKVLAHLRRLASTD